MLDRDEAANQPPDMRLAIRAIAKPVNANGNGDIFGRLIMSRIDLAGGNLASVSSSGRLANVIGKETAFHIPVRIGDEVTCCA